jgi:proteasome accessory factor A
MNTQKISPAVYGIETEYSCMVSLPEEGTHELVGACHSQDVQLGLYQQPKRSSMRQIRTLDVTEELLSMGIIRNPHEMLSNGGRFYEDPSGFEYCTPETATAEEAVLRNFDGDKILIRVLRGLQEKGKIISFQANRHCVDHNRSSRGVHINNSTKLTATPSRDDIKALRTLNVIKGALFGSGGLLLNNDGITQYHHSPRLSVTNHDGETTPTYTQRSLVRYPFKDDSSCNRIETITSDALHFPWPLRASMVVTNAALKLIENNRHDAFPTLRNPIRAAHVVGMNGNKDLISIEDLSGKYRGVRPIEILRSIAEVALDAHNETGMLDKESGQVLEEVIMIADMMEDDPFSTAPYVESIARLLAMQQKMEQSGVSLDSEKMCKFDYYWDKIDGGLAEQLREKGKASWLGFSKKDLPQETKKRIITPPQDTRAKIRGNFIKETKGKIDCDWHKIMPNKGPDIYLDTLQTEVDFTLY